MRPTSEYKMRFAVQKFLRSVILQRSEAEIAEIAKQIGWNPRNLHAWLLIPDPNPTMLTLERLADALGFDVRVNFDVRRKVAAQEEG